MPDTGGTINQSNASDLPQEKSPVADAKAAKKIVDWAQTQFAKMKGERSSIEQQWYLNLAFYFGRQNVIQRGNYGGSSIVSTTSGTLWTPPAPYYRARPVINRVRPTIRTELAKLTAQKPNAFVVPASSEDRDLYAAQAGEQIWETLYRERKLAKVFRKAVFWSLTCGTGFIKTYWDPEKPDYANDTVGDICYQAETPFHIYVPNMREEELENQPYLIHAQLKSNDWARMYFPQVNPQSGSGENSIVEETWLNLVGGTASREQNSILVLEVWVKPGTTAMFPQGAMFTIVGDQLVQGQMGWPYAHKEYPFSKIDHIPSGKFYGDSSIVDLIPLQREYNRTRGQIIEAKNRMAKPQLIAERGSVDASRITSEPGQVILYTPGFQPPSPLPLQALPSYVVQELERILTDWADISGIHEVSQGQVPPGVTAATAISYLQEQDESKLSHTVSSLEAAIENVAHLTLEYVQEFWDSQRAIKYIGKDGSFDYLALRGSDLRGNTDVQIEAGSALPTSRAARQAYLMDLMKMQFISPQDGLELMDMGGINRLQERMQVDKKQAQRENLKMSQVDPMMLQMHLQMEMQKAIDNGAVMDDISGAPIDQTTGEIVPPDLIVPVNTWDNHELHINEHNNYRKGQAFEDAPQHVKDLFDQHVQQHLDSIAALQMGMMGPSMPPPGSPEIAPMPPEETQPGGSASGSESAPTSQ